MTKEEYLLCCLAEELSEMSQAVGKCLRFRPMNRFEKGGPTNLDNVCTEFTDVMTLIHMLETQGIPIKHTGSADEIEKTFRLNHFYEYSEEINVVDNRYYDKGINLVYDKGLK